MYALINCDIYTGKQVEYDKAIIIDGDRIHDVVPTEEVPAGIEKQDLNGLCVAPGFIDIQVNGGGGVLFNDAPDVESIKTIIESHRRFGTTNLLPTFISGPISGMRKAAQAVQACLDKKVPGVLGIHFEGPFISLEKAGIHDKRFIRRPTDEDLSVIRPLRGGATLLTIAPEVMPADIISEIARLGTRVSLGHTNGTIIVDGFHVNFATVRIAIRAKIKKRKIILVTDAMPPVGQPGCSGFQLGGHNIKVENGCFVTEKGALAGSALDMATAVRNCVQKVGIAKDEALRMASTYPAEFLGMDNELGYIAPGYRANLVIFDNEIRVLATVVAGEYREAG